MDVTRANADFSGGPISEFFNSIDVERSLEIVTVEVAVGASSGRSATVMKGRNSSGFEIDAEPLIYSPGAILKTLALLRPLVFMVENSRAESIGSRVEP